MSNKRKKWVQHVIAFVLVIAMLLPMATPVSAQAAENDLYLAYQEDEFGTTVTKLKKAQRETYKVTELFLNVGDKADLCFINASFWKNAQWTSSNTKVVTIDSSGILTAVSEGVAEVTLTYSKKLSNKKVSASAKIYVGEENWNIEFAAGEFFLKGYGGRYDSYDLKVGGDMQLHIYGLGDIANSPIYRLTLESSDETVVQTIQDCIFARKAGTATITAKIKNDITGSVLEKQLVVNVTNPVYTEATEWDNPYYQMYGENYKRLFQNPSHLMLATADIENDMLDDALNLMEKKMKTLNWSGIGELVNLVNGLTIAAQGVMHGMDYLDKEAQRDAIMYLIQELLTNSGQHDLYENNAENALKKAQELFDDLDSVNELSEQIKILETAGLNIKKTEMDSILEYLTGDASGDIAGALSKGVTATEYAALTLCLYEMDNQILDDLQACSYPGNPLYEGVELIRAEREKDPLEFFRQKYCSETFAECAAELIFKLAGKEITAFSSAVSDAVNLVLDMAGVPKLSETVKAQYLMCYIGEVKSKTLDIRWELQVRAGTYSDVELMEKIEEYENAYRLYLAMVAPAVEAVEALEKYGNNPVLAADAAIPSMGYDYNRHIATAMSAYLHYTPDTAQYEKVAISLDNISETEVYSFQNVASGLYMNVDGGKSKNGTEIDLWSLDMSEPVSQRYVFKVVDAEKGIVRIAPEPSQDMYLDVRLRLGAFEEGKEMCLWEIDDSPSYKEMIMEKQPDGSFYITFAEEPGYCIGAPTVEAAGTKKANMTVCKKDGGAEQRWILCDKDGTPVVPYSIGYTTSVDYAKYNATTHQVRVVYKNSTVGTTNVGSSYTECHTFKDGFCQYCNVEKADTQDDELQTRMEELVAELLRANRGITGNEDAQNPYFTTTGKSVASDEDDRCRNDYVIKEEWFQKVFGENINASNFPMHLAITKENNIGWSCFGFACFGQWYLYKENNTDKVTARQEVVGNFTRDFLQNNLQVGDVIRVKITSSLSHSMIFHSFTEDGIMVLDCNYGNANMVRIGEVKYTEWSKKCPVYIYRVQE